MKQLSHENAVKLKEVIRRDKNFYRPWSSLRAGNCST